MFKIRLNSFLVCMPLRIGAMIVGYLGIMSSLLEILSAVFAIFYASFNREKVLETIHKELDVYFPDKDFQTFNVEGYIHCNYFINLIITIINLFNFSGVLLACFVCIYMFRKVNCVCTSHPWNPNCKNNQWNKYYFLLISIFQNQLEFIQLWIIFMGTCTVFSTYVVFFYYKYSLIVVINAFFWIIVYSQHERMKCDLERKLAFSKYVEKLKKLEKEYVIDMI